MRKAFRIYTYTICTKKKEKENYYAHEKNLGLFSLSSRTHTKNTEMENEKKN